MHGSGARLKVHSLKLSSTANEGFVDDMTTYAFSDTLTDIELTINPQDKVQVALVDLFRTISAGCNDLYKQVLGLQARIGPDNINQRVADLDKAARHIDINLQHVAAQVGHQGPGQHQGGDKYKKGILEYKVIQTIKPLTGDKSHFRQWHQQLINALSTINEDHSEAIKDMD